MIERVLVFTGSFYAASALSQYCSEIDKKLDTHFIALQRESYFCQENVNISIIMNNDLFHFDSIIRKNYKKNKSICFIFDALYRRIDIFKTYLIAVQKVFPEADIIVFCALEPQYVSFEEMRNVYSLPGFWAGKPGLRPWVRLMKYDDFLSTAFSLCGQGRVHVLPWLPDEPPHEFLHRFGDAAGLSFLMQAPSDFSPYRAPGYFFDFVRESFGWRKPYTEESATPWTAQIGRFKQRNPQLKSVPVLRPGFHKELMQFFEDSNANAARMLGMERLFPSQTESEDVSERLNQDNALRVAESLEPAFAGELLREFQENHNYLSFNGRLCLQALSRTCGARSVVVQYPQPKVSVLTLAYNHAAFIAENIESVIAQKTSFPIQHVIADDASDDGTQDIILKYAAKYPHIVPVLQKKRTYGSGNVQTLFEMARAEYVALCDGDDYFTDSDKLQIQADFLDANPDCALCAHSTRVIYEGRPDLKESVYPQLPDSEPLFFGSFKNLALANFISTSSVMYRWRFRDGLPDWFRPDLMPGDWYWHLLHAEVGGIGIINKVMSVYRKHPGGVYSSAIKDPLKHRNDTALYYMGVFNVILDHFSGKFDDELLLSSAVQILRECLLYYKQGREGAVFQTIIEKYPVLSQKIVNLMAKQGAG